LTNILGIFKQGKTNWEWLHNPPASFHDNTVGLPVLDVKDIKAVYNRAGNYMAISAGFLQLLLFSRHYPASVNYGSVGFVIGHEITHGFDNTGIPYNKNGVHDPTWLGDNNFTAEFNKRAQCLVDQYDKFNITSDGTVFSLNGTRTLAENIADGGGLNIAYRAYQEVRTKARLSNPARFVNPALPGSNFTDLQLFYISFAQMYCSVDTESTRRGMMVGSVNGRERLHSPERFRVLGSLANSAKFAQAFQCPVGSPMNPKHKCHLWA